MRTLAAAVLLCASVAYADPPGEELFQALDLDGDGYVSLSEAAGNEVVVSRFDRADRDRDGKLSPKEFANLKKVKVRVATRKQEKGKQEKEESAAAGGSAPKRR